MIANHAAVAQNPEFMTDLAQPAPTITLDCGCGLYVNVPTAWTEQHRQTNK